MAPLPEGHNDNVLTFGTIDAVSGSHPPHLFLCRHSSGSVSVLFFSGCRLAVGPPCIGFRQQNDGLEAHHSAPRERHVFGSEKASGACRGDRPSSAPHKGSAPPPCAHPDHAGSTHARSRPRGGSKAGPQMPRSHDMPSGRPDRHHAIRDGSAGTLRKHRHRPSVTEMAFWIKLSKAGINRCNSLILIIRVIILQFTFIQINP